MTGMTEILRILGVVALAVAEGGLLKECSNGHVRVAAKEVSGRASNAGIAKSPRFCNGRKTSKTLLEKHLLAKHEYKRQRGGLFNDKEGWRWTRSNSSGEEEEEETAQK